MYPPQVISLASDVYSSSNKLCRIFKGKETPSFKQFAQDCSTFGVDIRSIFPETHSFNEILYCLMKDSGPIKCPVCGKIIANARYGKLRCSIKCRSADKNYEQKISKIKTKLYSDPIWKKETEAKKCKTTRKNHGVDYPMQNVDIFKKQQDACFEKDENGLHGYEPPAYGWLKQLYNPIMNGHDYLKANNLKIKWLGDDGKWHHSYPDFFLPEINTFVEVKGEYTRKLHHNKLMKCAEELYNMKFGYSICTVKPKKYSRLKISTSTT